MSENQEEAVFSRKVIDMLTVANEFCLFIEKGEEHTQKDTLEYLQKLLPLIYFKMSLVPEIEVSDESTAEHFVTEEEWENIFNIIRIKLGDKDEYFSVNYDDKSDHESLKCSIAEGIADVYQDMKDFILLYQKPTKSAQENAVNDCHHLYETRTGFKLVSLIQAVHQILYSGKADDGVIHPYDELF